MGIFTVRGKTNILLLLLLIVVIETIGIVSGFLGNSASTQFEGLIKPGFSPPSWVFPVVWTILYFLMALALYRVLLGGGMGKDRKQAVLIFGIQLFLNFIWTPIFFGFNLYGAAFLVLLLLLVFILWTTIAFSKIDKLAALLMIPYIIWVSFAGLLNYYIWILNR